VPDMQGKTVVVTGGNSGIGFETAAALAAMGARVVVTARNADKGRAAVAAIAQRAGGDAQVQLVVFDLADLSSVRRGAAEILEQAPRLDVLVNNAGLVLSERAETVDGFEATLATNHLGPFLLTNLLLERIRVSAPARIVNVASTAHNAARKGMSFDDLQSEKKYATMRVYGQSKLANILFTLELARRLEGSGVTANSLHPGTVRTGYGADGDARGLLAFGIKISAPFFLSPAKGARTSVYLASDPEVAKVSGQYFVKCKAKQPKRWARDPDAARRLWQVSEELVGLAPAGV
jgi:NAD(P)-dependent dehydrogenase (short-subunit alcohol dehydrogenase family)